jgi:hypothetical protein
MLLDAVVELALDQAALLVGCRDDARARGTKRLDLDLELELGWRAVDRRNLLRQDSEELSRTPPRASREPTPRPTWVAAPRRGRQPPR